MNLPVSRNSTYGANSPILSADINALQDCVIGSKHPLLEIPVNLGSFRASGSSTYNGTAWSFAAAGDQIKGFTRIPVGSRIVQVQFYYLRNSAGSIELALLTNARAGGIDSTVAFTTDITGTVATSKMLSAVNYVVPTALDVTIAAIADATAGAAGAKFYGASIFVDRL